MKPNRTTTGVLLVVLLAFVGFVLLYAPQWGVQQYHAIKDAGRGWTIAYFVVVGSGAALLLAATLWIFVRLLWQSRRKSRRRTRRNKNPSELSAEDKQYEIEENLAAVVGYQDDLEWESPLRQELKPLIDELEQKREAQTLEIVAFGTVSSGKSSLLNSLAGRDVFVTDPRGGTTLQRNQIPWPGIDRVLLVDTPGLNEIDGGGHAEVSSEAAANADLVLLVVDGPLRASEHQLLQQLVAMEKRVILCLNKEDWYDSDDRNLLLAQLGQQVKGAISPRDVVAVRATPTQRRRVRLLPDGREVEEQVEVPADIEALATRMLEVIRRDGADLLLANLLMKSRGLVESARGRVEAALDRRAWEMVDHYMWGAGGAAAISPLPLLDLAAGGAVSAKMVVELAKVYHQDIDFQVAVNLLGQLGKNLLGILGVSAVTPAVTAAVASLMKTVPGAGTIAGGVLQGLVQALITRWIGGVFIKYFKNEMKCPEGGFAGLARREWRKATRPDELRKLLQSARRYYGRAADADPFRGRK
ncbi:MAG: YcjF family protein [Planctomycetota bacterium]